MNQMKPPPDIFRVIYPAPEAVPPVHRGLPSALVGGLFSQPNVSLSYLKSSRRLIESSIDDLRDVAIPIAHSQRHALEVQVKMLIELVYASESCRRWLAGPTREAPTYKPARMIHSLDKLLEDLRAGLVSVGRKRDDAPNDLESAVQELTRIEDRMPTRLRYSQVKPGVLSFRWLTRLSVADMQERLEALFADHLVPRGFWEPVPDNFATSLLRQHVCLVQGVRQVLDPLHVGVRIPSSPLLPPALADSAG